MSRTVGLEQGQTVCVTESIADGLQALGPGGARCLLPVVMEIRQCL